MTFSERVKLIRSETGMNQSELASALGMTRDAYANFEYDRIKNPNAKQPTIKAICDKFNVNEAWLKDGVGEMHPPKTREKEIADLAKQMLYADEDDFKSELIKLIAEMPDEMITYIKDWTIAYAEKVKNKELPD